MSGNLMREGNSNKVSITFKMCNMQAPDNNSRKSIQSPNSYDRHHQLKISGR